MQGNSSPYATPSPHRPRSRARSISSSPTSSRPITRARWPSARRPSIFPMEQPKSPMDTAYQESPTPSRSTAPTIMWAPCRRMAHTTSSSIRRSVRAPTVTRFFRARWREPSRWAASGCTTSQNDHHVPKVVKGPIPHRGQWRILPRRRHVRYLRQGDGRKGRDDHDRYTGVRVLHPRAGQGLLRRRDQGPPRVRAEQPSHRVPYGWRHGRRRAYRPPRSRPPTRAED